MCYTYIIRCKNNTLYTGYTTDIIRRMEEHKKGINSKYTRAKGFDKLEVFFESDSKSQAMKLEYYIKKLRLMYNVADPLYISLKFIQSPNVLCKQDNDLVCFPYA